MMHPNKRSTIEIEIPRLLKEFDDQPNMTNLIKDVTNNKPFVTLMVSKKWRLEDEE